MLDGGHYCCCCSFKFYLLIYFWLCLVFIALCRFALVVVSRGTLCCGVWASHFGGFSGCRAQALGTRASVVPALRVSSGSERALGLGLSSCAAWT